MLLYSVRVLGGLRQAHIGHCTKRNWVGSVNWLVGSCSCSLGSRLLGNARDLRQFSSVFLSGC